MVFYLCDRTNLILFTNTVQRVLLLIRRIILGLHTIAAGKIGKYIDVQTAIAVAQLAFNHREIKNLMQRIIEFATSLLDGLGWSGW